jgi:hypothetical protein
VVAETPSTPIAPARSASPRRAGVKALSRRRKLRATASTEAQNTALNAEIPPTISTAIAASDVK